MGWSFWCVRVGWLDWRCPLLSRKDAGASNNDSWSVVSTEMTVASEDYDRDLGKVTKMLVSARQIHGMTEWMKVKEDMLSSSICQKNS